MCCAGVGQTTSLSQRRWAGLSWPPVMDIVPQHEGFEPQRGRLEIPEGLFPRPAQVADGFIVDGETYTG